MKGKHDKENNLCDAYNKHNDSTLAQVILDFKVCISKGSFKSRSDYFPSWVVPKKNLEHTLLWWDDDLSVFKSFSSPFQKGIIRYAQVL